MPNGPNDFDPEESKVTVRVVAISDYNTAQWSDEKTVLARSDCYALAALQHLMDARLTCKEVRVCRFVNGEIVQLWQRDSSPLRCKLEWPTK